MALTNSKRSKLSWKNSKTGKAGSARSRVSSASATTVTNSSSMRAKHQAFWPLVILTFLVWFVYRAVFNFPVWFDESIGKALFFGLPVWLYISITGSQSIVDTLSVSKFKSGLLLGIAVGGLLGFASTLFALVAGNGVASVQPAALFSSPLFWGEFILAIMTGFWETILFFSWMLVVIQEKMRNWSLAKQLVVISGIFTLFHLPNALVRFDLATLLPFAFLMFLFAIGQAMLFMYRRNAYALILSQALWGMVLLLHF